MRYLNKKDHSPLKTATILSTLALFAVVTSIVMLSAPPFWLSAEAATDEEEANEQSASVGTVIPGSTDSDTIPITISNITDLDNITDSIPGSTDSDTISDVILNATVPDSSGQEHADVENEQDDEDVLETDNLEDLAKYA